MKSRAGLIAGMAAIAVVITAVVLVISNPQWLPMQRFVPKAGLRYQPRKPIDTSGYSPVALKHPGWPADATLEEIAETWKNVGSELIVGLDRELATRSRWDDDKVFMTLTKATLYLYDGKPAQAYELLGQLRSDVERVDPVAESWIYTILYLQGVSALRRGEDENCIMCRGESSCILPIVPAAVHTNPGGSQQAIRHFTDYLDMFPDDLEVRWLLNLAHMTLGEHPGKVEPKYLISLDRYNNSEFDIGRFRDVGDRAGVNRLNQAGGAILEDFDNDGLLDVFITSQDPTVPAAYFRNKADGTFEDHSKQAGILNQVGGGLNCVQTDFNNDGFMDVFILRGAWIDYPVRPSLLRNNGNGTFTDVTKQAGLDQPVNSGSASWADFNNDGFLDVYICCEKQPCKLYRNKGDGTFEDVTAASGLPTDVRFGKGCAWIDFDNDGLPDLFINYMADPKTDLLRNAQLFRNNGNGTFTDVSREMGIDGPKLGFSCWAFDFDNDGYLDIFATSYDRTVTDVVKGLLGEPHERQANRLFRNVGGKGFKDVTKEAGLDMVFAAMGSNFADLDNDGYVDMYLGTGDPNLATLVPNRMFKNVAGKRFAEISSSTGTGHLQKGHGVACGDWRRNGLTDIFIEMGGAINGDKYHNCLFLNPGNKNQWLTVKLIGKKTNRPAIGARIKIVTSGPNPMTIHRHVTSGSSFGANPLQQTIGLSAADKIALLEISWPTSGTTQVFRDLAVNQAIEVTEFSKDYRKLDWKAIPTPK